MRSAAFSLIATTLLSVCGLISGESFVASGTPQLVLQAFV